MRGQQPWRTNRARALRSRATSAEQKLWFRLRNRQFGGMKFARQVSIEPFYVDFLCRERKIIIEIDGATHGEPDEIAHDARRTQRLESLGFRVFRANNADIHENIEGVLETLLEFISGPSA